MSVRHCDLERRNLLAFFSPLVHVDDPIEDKNSEINKHITGLQILSNDTDGLASWLGC